MEYKYKWYIPDAYLHSRGTGYFTSHEGCAFINETDRDAHVRFTFYFQDREPMTGYTSVVPARRTKHARFDLMENDKGEPVPMNVGYAVVVESDMDMPVQFSHCDTSQPELTLPPPWSPTSPWTGRTNPQNTEEAHRPPAGALLLCMLLIEEGRADILIIRLR